MVWFPYFFEVLKEYLQLNNEIPARRIIEKARNFLTNWEAHYTNGSNYRMQRHFLKSANVKLTIQSMQISEEWSLKIFQSILHSLGCNSSLDGIQIDVIHYKPHTLSLRSFKFFFRLLHWLLHLWSCFIKWYEKEQSIKLRPLRVHNGESCTFFRSEMAGRNGRENQSFWNRRGEGPGDEVERHH